MKIRMKRALALFLVLLLTVGLLPAQGVTQAGERFTDTQNHWARTAIETWAERGIVSGYGGMFRPDAPITRAEMAQITVNLLRLKTPSGNSFTDVASDAWYADAVQCCAGAGVMQGDGGAFRPEANISRQEAMVVLARALEIQPREPADLSAFPDAGAVADWAEGYVAALTGRGIVNGTGTGELAPAAEISRAEVVTILSNAVSDYIAAPGTYSLERQNGGIALVVNGGVTLSGTAGDIVLRAEGGSAELKDLTAGTVTVAADRMDVHVTGGSHLDCLTVRPDAEQVSVELEDDTVVTEYVPAEDTQLTHNSAASGGTEDETEHESEEGTVVLTGGADIEALEAGSQTALEFAVTPDKAVLTAVSSDEAVVQAQVEGHRVLVNGVAAGTAVLTVTAAANGYLSTSRQYNVTVTEPEAPEDGFVLFDGTNVPDLYVSSEDYPQVIRAMGDLQLDVERVTEHKPEIKNDPQQLGRLAVIAGSVDQSPVIRSLMEAGKLDEARQLEGKWESYLLKIVDEPVEGVDRALVIAGSDMRGTIYGIYDLSEQIGVSPWYYWGDIEPQVQSRIVIDTPLKMEGEPSVQYRGIFINDEQNMIQWAQETEEKEPGTAWEDGNINPDTYAKIYELLLRLKANYLWPAMHSEPRLGPADYFNKYPENRELADAYGIIVGTSHCEPMMRNGTAEWGVFLQENGYLTGLDLMQAIGSNKVDDWMYNYNKNHPDEDPIPRYDYSESDEQRSFIDRYWEESVQAYKDYEVSYTLGMRGVHDAGFRTANASTQEEKLAVLQDVVDSQVDMLERNEVNEDAFPIFIPYKEVLPLYEAGLELPEDTIIVWADDNHGYIRRFPTEEEKQTYAGSGVYYHLNYEGTGSYSWLNSVSPDLMLSELRKAYEGGIQSLWVVNVGDLKPSEISIQLFTEMAWDIDRWDESNLEGTQDESSFYEQLSEKWFPDVDSQQTAQLLEEYYDLVAILKPDHTTGSTGGKKFGFSQVNYGDELSQRVAQLQEMAQQAQAIFDTLYETDRAQADAFYQHVAYQIIATYYNNLKYYHSQKNALCLEQGRTAAANFHAQMVDWAHEQEDLATDYYNTGMSDGKWNLIMQPHNSNNLRPDRSPKPSATTVDTVGYISRMGVVTEGEQVPGEDSVLQFSAYLEDTHFIDVYNQGTRPFAYTATADQAWVTVSEHSGTIYDEQRLFVDIDWDALPAGDQTAVLTITGAGSEKTITLHVSNPALPRTEIQGYAEANGYVAMEAEHYTSSVENNGAGFFTTKSLGRSGDAVSAGPMGTASYDGNLTEAPYLTYQVYFQSAGTFPVTVYRIPTLDELGTQRVAIGVDDGTPVMISGQNKAESGNWSSNVVNGIEKCTATITIPSAGYHTIRLYMVDAGTAVDRIVINTGGEADSNLGPRESYHSQYNPDPSWTPALVSLERSYLDDYIQNTVEPRIAELEAAGDSASAGTLKSELAAVQASLEEIQADTVRRGYARLSCALAGIDFQANVDTEIAAYQQKAQAILAYAPAEGTVPLWDVQLVQEFYDRYHQVPDSFAEKVEYYDALCAAVDNARLVTLTAESQESANVTDNAMDGDPDTRWAASGGGYPRWIRIDLGKVYDISQIDISWYRSGTRSYQYRLSASVDGESNVQVLDRTGNSTPEYTSDQWNVSARYLQIDVTNATNGSGSASIYEITIHGQPAVDATPEQVQQLTEALEDARAVLEGLDEQAYTVDSCAALRTAVETAEALLSQERIGAGEAEQARGALEQAVDGLTGRTYQVHDTFDDAADVSALEGWTMVETGGTVTLEEDNGNRYLKLVQTAQGSGLSVEARRSFDGLSGVVYVQARVRSDTPATFFGAPYFYPSSDSNTILGALALRDGGSIRATYEHGSSNLKEVGRFSAGEWKTVTLILDSDSQTMQVYIDGALAASDLPLRNDMDTLGMLRFYSDDKNTDRPLLTAYVDDVFVYQRAEEQPGGEAVTAEQLRQAVDEARPAAEDPETYTVDSHAALTAAIQAAEAALAEENSAAYSACMAELTAARDGLRQRAYLVNDSFDELESLDQLTGWELVETGGTVTLEQTDTGRCLKLTQTTKEKGLSVEAKRSFDGASGVVYIEATVRSDTPASFVGLPFLYQDSAMERILGGVHLRDNGQIKTNFQGGNSASTQQVGTFEAGQWNTVTLVVDTDTDQMQVYINGALAASGLSMRNPVDTIGLLRFYTDDSSADRPAVEAYVDNVRVYQPAD